jgi:hypothetical protein
MSHWDDIDRELEDIEVLLYGEQDEDDFWLGERPLDEVIL